MPSPLSGLHHVSAIAGPPQPNVDFYVGVLGLRLVKRTVNFDDPGTYHLYYGDEAGRPGTAMTFFPWANAVPGRAGGGMPSATAFSVPSDSLDFWMGRFADRALDFDAPTERFGDAVLALADPDGLPLELVAHDAAPAEPIPDAHAIRGFHSVTLALADPTPTAKVLTDVFGWDEIGEEGGRLRFRAPGGGPASVVDLVRTDERGRPGAGTVHHVAFRARGDDEQRAWRDCAAHRRAAPDRREGSPVFSLHLFPRARRRPLRDRDRWTRLHRRRVRRRPRHRVETAAVARSPARDHCAASPSSHASDFTMSPHDPHADQLVRTAGAPFDRARAAVVILHGRGDSADGILGLAEEFAQPDVAYIAPQAAGHQWYPYSFLAPLSRNEPHLSSALRRRRAGAGARSRRRAFRQSGPC